MENLKENSSPFVGQRIRAARRSADLTLEELGRRIGISNQALSAIEKGKNNPSKQTLISLAKELRDDFGRSWLADYLREANLQKRVIVEGPSGRYEVGTVREWVGALLNQHKVSITKPQKVGNVVTGWVPLVGVVGDFYFSFNNVDAKPTKHVLVGGLPSNKKAVGITYNGTPMLDSCVNTGDILIVTTPPKSIKDEVALLFFKGRFIVRRWLPAGDKVRLMSLDNSCEPIEIIREKVECLGRLIGVLRFVK